MKNFYKYDLLIEKYEKIISTTIEENKTVIIKGPTGCGKSTYVPLLLDYSNKKIAIIEPRRIAVTSLYNVLTSVIGSKVGYKMRFNKKLRKDTNMVIYTDGAFLNDVQYKEFDYIILDEVHERSVRTDVILSILRKTEAKVILMSATVETDKIQKYCNAKVVEIEGISHPVKIVYNEEPISDYIIEAYTIIKGIVLDDKKRKDILKTKKLKNKKSKNKELKNKELNYRTIDDDVNDFLELKNDQDDDNDTDNNKDNKDDDNNKDNKDDDNDKDTDDYKDDNDTDNKDILVFLTGEEDINELYKLLKRILNISVFKIYSSLSDTEQSKIFENSPLRKVILSTNICETSLTIPGIKYVIDTGLAKTKIFDKIEYMGILSISKESAEQRTGRCNRTGPGVCFRLYPEEIFLKMKPLIPEIKRTDLSNCILQLANFGINIFDCEILDYPPQSNVLYAIQFLLSKKLIFLNIDNGKKTYRIEDNSILECKSTKKIPLCKDKINTLLENIFDATMKINITNYGRIVNSLPFDVNLACFYQECLNNNVSYYGSMITAMISLNNYNFIKSSTDCKSDLEYKSSTDCKSDLEYKSSTDCKSDLEYLIKLFEDFLLSENKYLFCREKGVSQKFLEKAANIFQKLNKKKGGDIFTLEKVFSNSFAFNKSIKSQDGSYTHLESGRKVYIHPSSCLFKKSEKKIVFVDVLCTTKEYVRIVGKYL